MARYYVSGAGLTYRSSIGVDRHIGRGFFFDTELDDAPPGWTPPPDADLLRPMDEPARKALQAAIDAKRAECGGDAQGLSGGLGRVEIWRP